LSQLYKKGLSEKKKEGPVLEKKAMGHGKKRKARQKEVFQRKGKK